MDRGLPTPPPEQELAGMFGITGIPTVIIFREKIGIRKLAGMLPEKELENLLADVKTENMAEVRRQMEEQHSLEEGGEEQS